MSDEKPVRILSLDGGGVRGLSSLYILKELMKQVSLQRAHDNPEAPKSTTLPCEVFDLICGTSTGGLIALMLGRLRMSVDDCIEAYINLAPKLFTPKPTAESTFDHTTLEKEFQNIIEKQNFPRNAPLADPHPSACKTFVVATSTRAAGEPVLMQTYDNFPSNEAFNCEIWEAARATSAAPTYFVPITINRVAYCDGGTGWNNPVQLALDEAHNIWPNRPIACVISIGTGLRDAIQLGATENNQTFARYLISKVSAKTSFKLNVAEWCVELVTSSEATHSRLAARTDRLGLEEKYFRFNVPQSMSKIGLADWEKIDDMIALAEDYMRKGDMRRTKHRVGVILLNPVSTGSANGAVEPIMASRTSVFHVPYPRNYTFQGRDDVFTKIDGHFSNPKPGFATSFALYGMGGIGKTQIAIEHAYQHKDQFDIVWWLGGSDRRMCIESYFEMSGNESLAKLGVPCHLKGNFDKEAVAKDIKKWFEEQATVKWLLIVDDVKTIERPEKNGIVDLIPHAGIGCVLITSRNPKTHGDVANGGLEVNVMGEEDAVHLFLNSSHLPDLEATAEDVTTLVTALGCLPLAIEQAAGYIRSSKGISIQHFLKLFNENIMQFLTEPSVSTSTFAYKETVASVWELAVREISVDSPLPIEILRIASFLDGRQIPVELFENAEEILKAQVPLSKASPWDVEHAIRILKSKSLVSGLDGNNIAIHPLVQSVTREELGLRRYDMFCTAVRLLLGKFSSVDSAPTNFSQCLEYASHARQCAERSFDFDEISGDVRLLLHRLGEVYFRDGQHHESLYYWRSLLSIYDHIYGVDHVLSTTTLEWIGTVLSSMDKPEEAIEYLERSRRIRQENGKHVGPTLFINLGFSNFQLCRYQDTEVYCELGINRVADLLGLNSGDLSILNVDVRELIRNCTNNGQRALWADAAAAIALLAKLKRLTGDPSQALSLIQRAVEIVECLGLEDLSAARIFTELGLQLNSTEHFKTSKTVLERAILITDTIMGPLHIQSVSALSEYAKAHQAEKSYETALDLWKKIMTILENRNQRGWYYAVALFNVAQIYCDNGAHVQAESYAKRAVEGFASIGEVNAVSAKVKWGNLVVSYLLLGNCWSKYRDLKMLEKAYQAYERANDICIAHLHGSELRLNSEMSLARLCLDRLNCVKEAADRYTTVMEYIEKTLGQSPERSAIYGLMLIRLGSAKYLQGYFTGAKHLYDRALQILEKSSSLDHVAQALSALGEVNGALDQVEDAISYCEQALKLEESFHGKDSLMLVPTLERLGELFLRKGEWSGATKYYERVIELYQRNHSGRIKLQAIKAFAGLALVSVSQGQYLQATRLIVDLSTAIQEVQVATYPGGLVGLYMLDVCISAGVANEVPLDALPAPLEVIVTDLCQKFGEYAEPVAFAKSKIARLYHHIGRPEQAEIYFKEAIAIIEELHPELLTRFNYIFESYAEFLIDQGNTSAAIEMLNRVIECYSKVFSEDHIRSATAFHYLGKAFARAKEYPSAIDSFSRSLRIIESTFGKEHIKAAEIMKDFGTMYVENGERSKAKDLLNRAERIFCADEAFGPENPFVCEIRETLKKLDSIGLSGVIDKMKSLFK